ncbi:MAG TPA: hypothetical protein VN426_02025 [Syntrophomonadaceae bacterium]|nr:hypothetical protein [Syntrophomonadaceae bacterium]
MKKLNYLENWADMLLDDLEALGHPMIQHTTLSTHEFNVALSTLSFDQRDSSEWTDRLQALMEEWNYPIIEVIPLTREAYNQQLRQLFGLEQQPTPIFQIPDMRKPLVLSKVS